MKNAVGRIAIISLWGRVLERRAVMPVIDAVYRRWVFVPLEPVDLQEGQRVRLTIEAARKLTRAEWRASVREIQDRILARRNGELLPDSTPDIAADRLRDI